MSNDFDHLLLLLLLLLLLSPNAANHNFHNYCSEQFRRICHVSFTPVVPACCIHSLGLSVRLFLPCPCTFCISFCIACLSVFTFMTLVLDAWSCAAVRSPSVSFFRLPDAQFTSRSFSQQLLASFPGGTVHHAVSSSTYRCDPVLACVCAGCQSHRSGQSTRFLP